MARKSMRAFLALIALAAFGAVSLAGEIRTGATMQVKPYSVWFEEADGLAHWQARKKSADAAAFASYQENLLHQRDAWQFTNRQAVTILGFEPEKNRVHVRMQTTGRLENSTWWLDPGALVTAGP
jgi:hypothetical protein